MKRIMEIERRLAEIRALMRSDAQADLDALEKEIGELVQERDQLLRRQDIAYRAMSGGVLGGFMPIEGTAGQTGAQQRSDGFDEPAEYRSAWAASMMGRQLSDEQKRVYEETNASYRAYTHTTENSAVLIPKTVVAGIWAIAAEEHPLWDDVNKFFVPGMLTMVKHDSIKAGDAAWYDEATETADEENVFAEVNLSGCELAKSVPVSWKLRAMAVSEFIPYIEREIGERIGNALGTAAASGKGKAEGQKPEPRGIKTALEAEADTPQVVTYTKGSLTDAELRAAVAKIHSSFIATSAVYCNNNTAWTVLANVKDAQKRPLFLNDQAQQGAVGRMFGMPVKVDSGIADDVIIIGSPQKGYIANVAQDMTIHMDEHAKARKTDYVGYAVVDGDVISTKAFALLKVASA